MVYSVDKLRRSYQDFLFYAFLFLLQIRGILDYQKPNLVTKEILNTWHYLNVFSTLSPSDYHVLLKTDQSK